MIGKPSPIEPRDCAFDEAGQWFRLRACAVLIHEGRVLMASNAQDPYLYSTGGGVHHGERLEDAARRECLEETGLDLAVDRLLFIHEQVFTEEETPALQGRLCHELAFYFLMVYDGEPVRATASVTSDGLEEHCLWVPIETFGQGQRMYPKFFAHELQHLPEHPKLITS